MHPRVTMADPGTANLFMKHQREHECSDCGHPYLDLDLTGAGPHVRRRRVGGGTIVADTSGPLRELHVLPHCGTELPADLLAAVDPADYGRLAQLVHDNLDLGTAAIYRLLVEDIVAGRAPGVAVAGFHLSRIMLDANRDAVHEQVPENPYAGSGELYRDYHLSEGLRLRDEELLPWLAAVDDMLREMGGQGSVYHHHTYDVYSISPRPWDRGFTPKRPAFQLIWSRPLVRRAGEHAAVGDPGLARLEDIERVRESIRNFLEREIGVGNGTGQVDYPLLLPVLPFRGTRRGDPADSPRHLVYDLRKDLLATDRQLRSWVSTAPWRFPAAGPAEVPSDTDAVPSANAG
ncbi:hypothetical protein [Verrucosispora sp. WMMD573]|uniref:hypothetical protein n=1 Tax=Verrucosispora sp. WMMD573 TaxID=3015149 RepID=UPI00248C48D4|nr:hypothetical protein [Verrucosispora sp. WMMD573]WBB56463.1 hypothetical protein O7601_10560 [Verrucosispora sp. WMMD573]